MNNPVVERRDSATPESPNVDFKTYVKERLTGLFFSGDYKDRIFVDELSGYRDRVIVNPDEVAASKIFKSILRSSRKSGTFLGLQKVEDGFSLFVRWKAGPEPPPFGSYWLLVEDLLFHPAGFDVVLNPLRSREEEIQRRICPHCKEGLDRSTVNPEEQTLLEASVEAKNQIMESIRPDLWMDVAKNHMTVENLKMGGRFIGLIAVAAVTAVVAFVKNLLPMLNRCLLSLGVVIQKSTPFLLGCLDSFNKIIGAFFLIVNRIWVDVIQGVKRHRQPKQPPNAIVLKGANYWSQQNVSSSENSRTGRLYLQNQSNEHVEQPRFPYLRKDINRPYLQDH